MLDRIKSNKNLENFNSENDYLGLERKSSMIKNFISSYYTDIEKETIENSMIVLYGEWGSGKTSVMYDIKNKLDNDYKDNKKGFKTFFFNAWEYEKDNNLPLSLFEMIIEESGIKDSISDSITNFLKRVRFKGKLSTKIIPGIDVTVDLKDKKVSNSFYSQLSNFKENFKKIEKKILTSKSEFFKDEEGKHSNIIIFIDDLDRCEPENILDLLSSIKLFFTYTDKTLYLSGIDKVAIKESVKIKYGNIIKSEAYLEKIFDISFHMPEEVNLKILIASSLGLEKTDKTVIHLKDFLEKINFTNPRHLKKIFNKYHILKFFIENYNGEIFDLELNRSINIIFTLYFIILFEFYTSEFKELENYKGRIEYFHKNLVKILESASINSRNRQISKRYDGRIENIEREALAIFFIPYLESIKIKFEFHQTHGFENYVEVLSLNNKNDSILINFSTYIYNLFENRDGDIILEDYGFNSNNYKFLNFFKLIKTII